MEHSVEVHKQIFFEEMGSLLKTKREELNLSVDYVVDELKFSKDIVYAMENATVERLPNPVYAKGFYRAYATLLAIDQSIIDAFINTAFVEKKQEPPAQLLNIQMGSDKEENTFDSLVDKTHKQAQRKKILIALIFVFIILLISGYIIVGKKDTPPVDTPASEESLSPVVEETTPNTQSVAQTPSESTVIAPEITPVAPAPKKEEVKAVAPEEQQNVQKTTAQQKKVATKATQKEKENNTATQQTNDVVQKEQTTTETAPVTNAEEVVQDSSSQSQEQSKTQTLRIVATGEVWVDVKYNGKRKDFTLQKGQTYSVEFTGTASVTIGDLSAAELYCGKKALKNLGAKGKVKTYTFSSDE